MKLVVLGGFITGLILMTTQAQASMALDSIAASLINQPNMTNDYSGTTPDGSYMSCGAGLSLRNGHLEAALSYGDTGAAVRGSLQQVASISRSGDVNYITWTSEEFRDTEVTLSVRDKAVVAMSITFHEKILFIPRNKTIVCENLVQFIPKTIR